MYFDFKGIEKSETKISDFISYLKEVSYNSLWLHNGLRVKIDPTVDFNNENVLIRWKDIDEGFNDKIIFHNLEEFKKEFTLLNA